MAVNKTLTHNFGLNTGYVEIDSSSIDFPVRRNILLQRQLIDVYVDCFSIENLSVSDYLEVDESSLVKIKFIGGVGKEGSKIMDFHLTSYNNPYQLLLNHDAITDCNDLDVSNAKITFTIKISFNGEVITKDYEINLNLVKAKPECTIQFVPKQNLKYKHENACVGVFEIENSCDFRYAEHAAVHLSIKYPQQFKEDLVSFALKSEMTESNPYYEVSGLREKGEDPISLLKFNRCSDQEIELKRITTQNIITIPVYLDLDKLDNPIDEVRNEKFVAIAKNILNDVPNDPMDCIVPVLRDYTGTRLFVSCNKLIVAKSSKDVYGHYSWIERQTGKRERFNGLIQIANIKIGNEATNRGVSPKSAVIIRNVKIYPIINEQEIVSSTDYFLDIKDIDEGQYIFRNDVDSFISYTCKLRHKNIERMHVNNSRIIFNIEFDYIEDEGGLFEHGNMEWNHYRSEAIIELEKDPGSEWLCVDYGTSATVAVFGDGTERNFQLLRLNERNKEIIAERENERFRNPRFEEGINFLSSNIMLQSNIPSLDADSIEHSLVYLSPSEPRFHAKGFRLPYMKALVGYKNIPNGDMYSAFKYKLHESDKDTLTFEDNPLDVDQIFRSTYRSLFKDYITACIPHDKSVNKIVLTVPNTYTPHHIEYLRKIVEKEIPSLRSDYVWFVSESDAIAYYYLKNYNQIYDNEFVEHVLVYDMGAGTLDLTYLTIEYQPNGDKKVEMVTKMGLNKAGNYLDYILAKALVDEYPELFPEEILSHSDDDTMENLLGKLKFYIKDTLKPNLFNEDSLVFSAWNGQTILGVDFHDVELDLALIRANEHVQSFITECTDDFFDRFTKIGNLAMDENPIDTLIMTGRSIQFGSIKNRLQQKINSWNDDNHCHSIEIAGEKLKTIVSQGALYYAALYGKRTSSVILRNKNIYAKYGVLYVDRQNSWRYQPLIDSNTRSTSKAISVVGQQNGMQIYTYDTDRFSADESTNYISLDMRNTIEAYLVQCYSPDPASDYKDEERRNDYISIIAAFNPESVSQDSRNVHVRLEINEDNEMTFTAGDLEFEASAPVKIDVETSNTFKHSMWPYA